MLAAALGGGVLHSVTRVSTGSRVLLQTGEAQLTGNCKTLIFNAI
jgi:hypothetical protein